MSSHIELSNGRDTVKIYTSSIPVGHRPIRFLAKQIEPIFGLVIDTADWLEKLIIEHLCQRNNKTSIEDFGYGKRLHPACKEFTKFLGPPTFSLLVECTFCS